MTLKVVFGKFSWLSLVCLLSVSCWYTLYLHNSKLLFETMLLGLESIMLFVLICVMLSFSINLLLAFVCMIPFCCCVVTFNLEFESSNWRSPLASMGLIMLKHNADFDVLSTRISLIFPYFYLFCFVSRWTETLMHNWLWI